MDAHCSSLSWSSHHTGQSRRTADGPWPYHPPVSLVVALPPIRPDTRVRVRPGQCSPGRADPGSIVGLPGGVGVVPPVLVSAEVAGGHRADAGRRFESGDEGVEAGCEPFVAVVKPDVFAEGDQCGEAVGWQ
jgi:hypothetical protein